MMHRILVVLAVLLLAKPASAFCGFYVAGADTPMFADATQVVLMRDGTRTVLSMQNDYKGPPADFAMVVPVPVVLQEENVKTLPHDVFEHVEHLSAPRLVEYWEQDPCGFGDLTTADKSGAGTGTGQGFGSGHGRLGAGNDVTVEAQFAVGEYQIVILSAKDAAGLDAWLKEGGYKIPDGAEPYLRPYVQAGSKFFVAKVDVTKVKIENGRARLSPLRFYYDSEKFELPVRLGLVSSSGTQDLIVHVLAQDKRYEVANYPNVTIPTNLDVAESARDRFGEFYAALFDRTVEANPKAVVTEYAWGASSCDPCPGNQKGLSNADIVTLGADVLPSMSGTRLSTPLVRQLKTEVTGQLPLEVIQRIIRQSFGKVRLCYEKGLEKKPKLSGTIRTKFTIDKNGKPKNVVDGASDLADKEMIACVERVFATLEFPPPDSGTVSVDYGINFSVSGFSLGRTSFVLTRLHARYSKDTLGADLVFKEAPPIVGGRESNPLEREARVTSYNGFQARYAIRHPWQGAIECKTPARGMWGGPWPSVAPFGGGVPEPKSATNLAYAPRGKLDLATVLAKMPETMGAPIPSASAAEEMDAGPADAGGAPATPKKSKCGCELPGTNGALDLSALGALAFAVTAAWRRRRA